MRSHRPLWVAVLMLWVSLVLLGCRPSHMHPVQAPQAIGPFADNAVVVFVYPEAPGKSPNTTILDGQGRFLGTAVSGTHYAVLMAPGGPTTPEPLLPMWQPAASTTSWSRPKPILPVPWSSFSP